MMDNKSSNYSLTESDTVELFNRDHIKALNQRLYKKTYRNYSILLIALILVIAVSTITLIKLSYSNVEDINDSHSEHQYDFVNSNTVPESHTINSQITPKNIHSISQCDNIEDKDKFDCNPDEPISQSVCQSRGCCWSTSKTNVTNKYNNPPLNVPFCYYGNNYVGYQVNNIEHDRYRTIVTLDRKIASGFPKDSQTIKLEITELNDYSIRLKFYDPMEIRYEVPFPKLNITRQRSIDNSLYTVSVTSDGIVKIVRKKTLKTVFKTDLKRLTFSDQYLQLSSELPTKYIYGIGEHKDGFRKEVTWKRYTLFNRDQFPIENMNLYGSHPFYLAVEDSNGSSSGVFLFNSNAMDIILQPKPAITWRTIGGILDFYVFLGPQPSDVVRQYNQLIGLPTLPPYWGLGFHLCRYGYKTLDNMKAVFNRTREAQIPYDIQWNDIDAMKNDNDFTYDDKQFAGLPQFVDHLHQIGMKYIPMFDCGISSGEKKGSYPPFDEGLAMNIFVKNSSGQPFEGKVWNKHSTVWPDFTNPKTIAYWTQQFARYHKLLPYDGAWIDMNEPSNFLDGSFNGCPSNSLENPQYVPGANNDPLRHHTVCMSAIQYAGLHYDVHNLYGFTEAIATNIALRTVRKNRELIISRSSFPGHGHYASHWDGDILSTWESMRWSIPSILNFNLFGIPMVGADICGFNGNTTVELCARWHQLGAFYPFSRNHNSDDAIDQDPVSLGPVVVEAAKNALEMRYALLPYLYTLFFRAHIYGDTVARPLFFEFPNDETSYEIETQFLWGSGLMIVPTLYENATSVNAYLPKGIWYNSKTFEGIKSNGQYFELQSPLSSINVLLRAGHIIAVQSPKTTTEETRKGDLILAVGLDSATKASGQLFWDSGDGLDNIILGEFNIFEFIAQNNTLISNPAFYGYEMSIKLSKAIIMGVNSRPKIVIVNNVKTNDYQYNQDIQLLTVNNIYAKLSQKIVIIWK